MASKQEPLSVTHPELASQAVDWDPTSLSAGSNKKVLWKCEKGHEWNARIADRLRFNSGCQVCANRVVLEGFNDLATTHPILSAQAHGWNPKQVHKGMTRKVSWKCEKGHEWNAQINSRTGQGHGCPICSGRSVLVGFNDLATVNPALAIEADGWDPSTFTAGSSKKVSWKCSSGHTWGATISSRSAGNGCPICSNRLLSIGVNDLLTTHPEIAREADGWDPTEVSAGTQKVMSWKCSIGHQYVQSVSYRTSDHCQGCPICGGQRVLAGFNDLATKFPEIAHEADGWDPTSVTSGSKRKSVWRCSLGHVYVQEVSLRTGKQKQGCPTCSGKRVLAGFNDLATKFPEIAREADGWDPTEVSAGTQKVFTWRCSIGHIFRASPNQRTSRTSNCPTCANKIIETGFNDLATTHPKLAKEAFGWDPKTIGGGSSQRLQWKCLKQKHVWESTIINRTSNGSNCPVCTGQLVITGVNDLATTHPEIAKQAVGWDPATMIAGSNKKRNWKCELGHIYSQGLTNRTGSSGQGCPYCAGTSVLSGFNDLATKFPELISEVDGWDPSMVAPGSNKKMKWMCIQGHSYLQAPNNRTGQKQGCPICANLKVLKGFNDLATTHPELSTEAFGWDPSTVVAGTPSKQDWKCSLGHIYSSSVSSRASNSRGRGCPVCDGKIVLPGFNDIATTHPSLAAEAFGWDTSTMLAGSNRKKMKWQCSEGHIWAAFPSARLGGHGCPTCARTGFDPNKAGWLYFLENDDLEMFQIGISNVLVNRLKRHSKGGWEPIEVRGPMKGQLAQELETAILHAVERRGAVLGHKAEIEKFDGYSEAWTKDSLTVTSFKQLLDWVYEDDQ